MTMVQSSYSQPHKHIKALESILRYNVKVEKHITTDNNRQERGTKQSRETKAKKNVHMAPSNIH